jgi:hypothetical protein
MLKATMVLDEFFPVKLGERVLALIGLESLTKRGMQILAELALPNQCSAA